MTSDSPDVALPRRLTPGQLVALDSLAAAGYTAILIAFTLAGRQHSLAALGVPRWGACLVDVAIGLPLAARRLWPLPAAAVVAIAAVAAGASGVSQGSLLAVAFCLYPVALNSQRSTRTSTGVLGALSAIVILGVAFLGPRANDLAAIVLGLAVIAAAWTIGRTVRERRAYAQAEAERLTERAAGEERLRIARELHDVVAHSMSLIAVKAGIANHVARSRPEETIDALRVIEDTSKSALSEMRRLLGVLRTDDTTDGELAPAPNLADLPELAQRAAGAGVHVDLDLHGDPDVPAGVGLSAYRIVQEALTNVVRHAAPAHCQITVTAQDGEVRIDVRDDGPGRRLLPAENGSGHGLAGMRERALVCGGELTAGPLNGSGFQVKARLPYTTVASR